VVAGPTTLLFKSKLVEFRNIFIMILQLFYVVIRSMEGKPFEIKKFREISKVVALFYFYLHCLLFLLQMTIISVFFND